MPRDRVQAERMGDGNRVDAQPLPGSPTGLVGILRADAQDASLDALLRVLAVARAQLLEASIPFGAVLFRGFRIQTPASFRQVMDTAFGDKRGYEQGNAPRTKVLPGIYTSTEFPASVPISLHNELSYCRHYPRLLCFWCEEPARRNGRTTIADARSILRELPPQLRRHWREKGITYLQNLHAGAGLGRSWMDTFETADRDEVEATLRASDATFSWRGDALRISRTRPATIPHPVTGEALWFNQAEQWHPSSLDEPTRRALVSLFEEDELPHHARFGDGSRLPDGDLACIRDAMRRNSFGVAWERGDLLLIDNALVAHGREAFTPPRRVLVSMTGEADGGNAP